MIALQEVRVGAWPLERFAPLVGEAAVAEAQAAAVSLRSSLGGRVVWNVNSTAVGGGVAEMLQSLLGYSRGASVDARWLVIGGTPEFFRVTKRLHHALQGSPGDGSPLDAAARAVYESHLARCAFEMLSRVRAGDVVLLHDPQTAGLAPALLSAGARVAFRCHIGDDVENDESALGYAFLAPYLDPVRTMIFSRAAYVPARYRDGRATILKPSIDAFSSKNQELDPEVVRGILVHVGIVEGPAAAACGFFRGDGTRGRVERRADVVRLGRAPSPDCPLVVQVSRWDPLKDMLGVMHGFSALAAHLPATSAHLVLAGPNVNAVADDPEAPAVFDEVHCAWRRLSHATRDRVHLVMLPTADVEENGAIVNALQRHAAVVVQKSLREGFGLTVTEALWKSRPVVASAVGGIRDQIEDGVSGLLVQDPSDLEAFAATLARLLVDGALSARLGAAGRERVRRNFLGIRHLVEVARLVEGLGTECATPQAGGPPW